MGRLRCRPDKGQDRSGGDASRRKPDGKYAALGRIVEPPQPNLVAVAEQVVLGPLDLERGKRDEPAEWAVAHPHLAQKAELEYGLGFEDVTFGEHVLTKGWVILVEAEAAAGTAQLALKDHWLCVLRTSCSVVFESRPASSVNAVEFVKLIKTLRIACKKWTVITALPRAFGRG